jgi:23S rRNA (adenine2503-C2)-methyltransferase
VVGQLIVAEREAKQRVSNLVFMGMGEPLANYANVLQALRILNAPWGIGLGARKITISTSGLAPEIEKLASEPLQVRLAISLHGATDAVRDRIMPVNRRFPLARLMAACEAYQRVKGRMITFEYILLAGVNDALPEAPLLAGLARRVHAKVNLIPFNEVPETGFRRPTDEQCRRFADAVARAGATVTLRTEKGHDIEAACGQLRLRHVRANATVATSRPPC